MFKFKSAAPAGQNKQKKVVTIASMMDEPETNTTTTQNEKILESRSSHWPRSKDTHGYQFKGAYKGPRGGLPEKLSQSSGRSSRSIESSSQDQIQTAELEGLVSGLASRASLANSKGVKPDKHPILSFQSKDDYEKLQDLLQSNKTVVTSGLHSLATEDLAEGLTPIQPNQ